MQSSQARRCVGRVSGGWSRTVNIAAYDGLTHIGAISVLVGLAVPNGCNVEGDEGDVAVCRTRGKKNKNSINIVARLH